MAHASVLQPERPAHAGPILAGMMFALSVTGYFDRTIISIAGPRILTDFHLTETQLGTIYSAFLCSYALLMIPGGYLADRIGPRTALTVMAIGTGVFTALTAAGGQPWLSLLIGVVPGFMLLRLAAGVFASPLYPACARMNANWFTAENRSRVQGIVSSGAGLGGALSPVIFSRMMARYGWQTSFVAAGIFTVLLGIVWHLSARDYPHPQHVFQRREPVRWRALLLNRQIVLLTLGFMCLDYFEYIFFYWSYYYFGQVRKLGSEQSVVYTTIMMLTWLVMTPFGGWLSDRLVKRWGVRKGLRSVAVGGFAASALLLFAGAHSTGTAATVTFISLALGFASCADVTFWAAAINVAGRQSGTASGIMNSGGNVGGFIAPILTPWIAGRAGWAAGLYFGSAVALLGMLTWFSIDPTKKLQAPDNVGRG